MSKAGEALTDVRRWLCDNLSDGDAGNVYSMCRMLYVVSRHANELEEENDKLREFAADACTVLRNHYDKDWFDGTIFAERMRELGIEVSNDD